MAPDLSNDVADEQIERIQAWLAAAPAEIGVPLARGIWPWRAFGEAALRHEHRIYSIIDGVPGVPRCLGLMNDSTLVLEHIEGTTFRQGEKQLERWDEFFLKLLETLHGIHARGVAHGDLKRKDNLLIGPGERPYIVDFGVASVERRATAPWSNYRWMRQYDYNAWVKLKNRRQLQNLSVDDAALYKPTMTERVARGIRKTWHKLSLRRLRRKHWPRQS